MRTATQQKSRGRKNRKHQSPVRQLRQDRKKFVEGVIAVALSGGALPYFVKDCVEEASGLLKRKF